MPEKITRLVDGRRKNKLCRVVFKIPDSSAIQESNGKQQRHDGEDIIPVLRYKRGVFPNIAIGAADAYVVGHGSAEGHEGKNEEENPGHGRAQPGSEFEGKKSAEHDFSLFSVVQRFRLLH